MINWNKTQEIVELLEDLFPEEDLETMEISDLQGRLTELTSYDGVMAPDWYSDDTEDKLYEILEGWRISRKNLKSWRVSPENL